MTAFWANAISRQDDSPFEGIHLLWTAPYAAGYSVTGYDIQRRQSQGQPRVNCYSLTRPELEALHSEFHLTTPLGFVSVQATACPQLPADIPDSPFQDDDDLPELHCVDFENQPGGIVLDIIDGLELAAFNAAGNRIPHVTLRQIGAARGLDCAIRLEIKLPAPGSQVSITLIRFSGPARIDALSMNTVVATATTSTGPGQAETITLEALRIDSVTITATSNAALLLRFCWRRIAQPNKCLELETLELGKYPSPLRTDLASFAVIDGDDNKQDLEIKEVDEHRGLDCGPLLSVVLVDPSDIVSVQLICFAEPAKVRVFNAEGKLLDSAVVQEPKTAETLTLLGPQVSALEIESPDRNTLLLRFCVQTAKQSPPPIRRLVQHRLAVSTAPLVIGGITSPPSCLRYRIVLNESHQLVQVTAQVPAMLAIAMREGKAVYIQWLIAVNGSQTFAVVGRGVDEVLLYTGRRISGLTICVDVPPSPEQEAAEWASVPYLVRELQMPLQAINAALGSPGDELALAQSRLIDGEVLDVNGFADVAQTMNETVDAKPTSPMWYSLLTRERLEDSFIEIRPWPFGLSLTTDAALRRALGFGYFDAGEDLIEGASYDYRITGHFLRRDIEEQLLGFHTIPAGTLLPATFYLDTVRFTSISPKTVELYRPVPDSALVRLARKGIRIQAGFPLLPSLTIAFAIPVRRIALEMEPDLTDDLEYAARTSDYIFALSGTVFSGSIAATARVTLEFPEPIDTLELRGDGFLYGVRILPVTPRNPDDVLDKTVVIYNVAYVPTPAPEPPAMLGTTNLQQPILPGDPAVTTQTPPKPMGFELHWSPPVTGASPPFWPTDLSAVPPFDVLGFNIERRRVDTGGPFEEIGGGAAPNMFFGNRGSRSDPPALEFGIDLIAVFPEIPTPIPPVDPLVSLDDILLSAAHPDGPPPGSLHQYRIFSVDAIGRRSTTATVGSVVRLEKHLPPPLPPGPEGDPPLGVTRPVGVRARVLQRLDPDLPAADIALLGASTNAIVLEWGWSAIERQSDPLATEFRIYWQPLPPDIIQGTLHGPAALVSGVYEMSCTLDQPVAADVMAGTYIRAPDYPFRVTSHTAGTVITVRLAPSVLQPATVPSDASFEFTPMLTGTELRPAAWAERSAVIPIGSGPPAPFIFRDRLVLDADHVRARVWVGVSAADAQSYVPDELSVAALNGGRPGNESSIVAAVAEARYRGRPEFVVPLPLPDVPEDVSPEPVGPTVQVRRDLPALLPAVAIPAGHSVVLDRLEVSHLSAAMSRREDGMIGVTFPDGGTGSYTLANADDQAALRAQIASGEPARIENRFVVDLLVRFRDQFESLWQRSIPTPVTFGVVVDMLPSKADRWLHRIRLVDRAGHISEGVAILPRVVRIASTRASSAPELRMSNSLTDSLTVEATTRDAFDLKWLVLFTLVTTDVTPLDDNLIKKAQLLRIPDRRDLYPNDGLRLRVADGALLAPAMVIDIRAAGTVEIPDIRIPAELVPGFSKRVSIWGITLIRDGIPSRLTGPRTAVTGPVPLVVPPLTVVATDSVDTSTWSLLVEPADVAIERSTDGGVNWTRVSPWLPPTSTTFSLPGSGARVYRLLLRGARGQTATGAVVAPT